MGMVADKIEARLRAALSPATLSITDDSDSHRGHAGHDGSGESHFTVKLTAAAFAGKSRVARQRLVYAALGDLMAPGGVHALVIKAHAPGEAA
jgi:BolA family transcriptional regulator, general stress-responsive regulator